MQNKMASDAEENLKARVDEALGETHAWERTAQGYRFRTYNEITLQRLNRLSAAIGTDTINFNFGNSGEPGYSDVTPGCPGEPGWIEIISPFPGVNKK